MCCNHNIIAHSVSTHNLPCHMFERQCFYHTQLMTHFRLASMTFHDFEFTRLHFMHVLYLDLKVQNILATPQADPSGLFTKCKQDITVCSSDQIQKLQGPYHFLLFRVFILDLVHSQNTLVMHLFTIQILDPSSQTHFWLPKMVRQEEDGLLTTALLMANVNTNQNGQEIFLQNLTTR